MSAASERHCTHPSLSKSVSISLPVMADHSPHGKIKPSKNGKRRAVVLAIVQLLIIGHIVVWLIGKDQGWFGGKTLSPVEPSESMEFAKHGVINAGLIFFCLALLSTLILGRWFCGWGCHIVMLQDLCGWMMKKCGIRPKPFRSRLLMLVPLLMALYMFIWPMAYRWGLVPLDAWMAGKWGTDSAAVTSLRNTFGFFGVPLGNPPPAWKVRNEIVRTGFWDTFPNSPYIIVPFLLICGFGAVYFLGAKGFCTYGCPYGGFFAPLDKLAVGKIRVTDACEGCGHCTAVCTSNVRVHEEVREYGMVVDPGCMKCLDCVSVCPNEALYFGFGHPTVAKGAAKNEAPKRKYDLTWGGEISLAIVFALSLLCFRGDFVPLPLLMSAGTAAVTTWLAWKLWRMLRDPNVTLHRFQLRLRGSIRPAGWLFGVIVMAVLTFTAHSGAMNVLLWQAQRHDNQVTVPPGMVFSGNPMQMPADMAVHADQALQMYRFVSRVNDGGWSVIGMPQEHIDTRIVWLLSATLDFPGAEAVARRAIERDGFTDVNIGNLMVVLNGQLRAAEALDFAEPLLRSNPELSGALDTFVRMANEAGQMDRAAELCKYRIQRNPKDLLAMRWLSMIHLTYGQLDEGIALTRRTIEIDPNNPNAYRILAMALRDAGRVDEAIVELQRAMNLDPDNPMLHEMMGEFLASAGRHDEAQKHRDRVNELISTQQPPAEHEH
jgi:polyferredoxin